MYFCYLMMFGCSLFSQSYFVLQWIAIASQLRERWRDNKRSSASKEDNNFGRWKQLRQLLEAGKQKVRYIPSSDFMKIL
jgi:hypothetical protein